MGRPSKQQLDTVMQKREEERGPGLFKRALGPVWGGVKAVGSDLQWLGAGSSEAMQAIPSIPIPGQEDKRWSPYSGIMGGLVEGLVQQTPFGVAGMALQLSGQKEKIQRNLEAQGKPSWLVAPHEALMTDEMEAGGIRDLSTAEGMRQEEMGRQTREAFKQTIPQMDPLQFINPVTGYLETRRRLKDPMMEIHKQRPEAEQAQMQLLSPFEIATAPIPIEKGFKAVKAIPHAYRAGKVGLEAAGLIKVKPLKGIRFEKGNVLDEQGNVVKSFEDLTADVKAEAQANNKFGRFLQKIGLARKRNKELMGDTLFDSETGRRLTPEEVNNIRIREGLEGGLRLDMYGNPLTTLDEWLKVKPGQAGIKNKAGSIIRGVDETDESWAAKYHAQLEAGMRHLDTFSEPAVLDFVPTSSIFRRASKFRVSYNKLRRAFENSLTPTQEQILRRVMKGKINPGDEGFVKALEENRAFRPDQIKLLRQMNPTTVLSRIRKDYDALLKKYNTASSRNSAEFIEKRTELHDEIDEILDIIGYKRTDRGYRNQGGKRLDAIYRWRGNIRPVMNQQDILDNIGDISMQINTDGKRTPHMFFQFIGEGDSKTRLVGEEALPVMMEEGGKIFRKVDGLWQANVYRDKLDAPGVVLEQSWGDVFKQAALVLKHTPASILKGLDVPHKWIGRFGIPVDTLDLKKGIPQSFAEHLLEGRVSTAEVRSVLNSLKEVIEKLPASATKQAGRVEQARRRQVKRMAESPGFAGVELEKILSGKMPNELDSPISELFSPEEAKKISDMVDEVFELARQSLDATYRGQMQALGDDGLKLLDDINKSTDPLEQLRLLDEFTTKTSPDMKVWNSSGLKGIFDLANARLAFDDMWKGRVIDDGSIIGIAPGNYSIGVIAEIFGADVGKALLKHRTNSIANWLKWASEKIPWAKGLEGVALPQNWIGRVGSRLGTPFGRMTPGEIIMDLAMLPKTIRASNDLSAPLRQGWVLLFNNPKLWAKAFNAQLKLVLPGGDAGALQLNNSIMRHPSFKMYTDIAKLSLTDVTGVSTRSVKEEAFLSNLARMIPGSRASERAYTGFLNKLRMDTMDNYVRNLEWNLGRKLNPRANPEDLQKLKAIADFVNDATGRGKLPWGDDWTKTTNIANILFWSPRFFTSRIMLPISSFRAAKATGQSTPQAIMGSVARTMVSWIGSSITALVMFKYLVPGADADLNPRSSNFGKIKVGNSSIDIWAGYGPIVRAVITLSGVDKVTATGKYIERGPLEDAKDVLGRFTQSKFSPTGGAIFKYAPIVGTGQGFFGEDADIIDDMNKAPWDSTSIYGQLLTPMFIEALRDAADTYMTPMVPADIAAKHGIDVSEPRPAWQRFMGMFVGAAPEFFGFSGATYYTRDDIAKELTSSWDDPRGYEELPQMGREPGIISQQRVKGLIKDIETARGIERTKGDTGRIQELRDKEQTSIQNIGTMLVKVGDDTKSVNEWIQLSRRGDIPLPRSVSKKVTDEFYDIRGEYGIRRNEVLYGKKWARKRTPEELSRMGFKQRILQQYRDESSKARGSDEYNAVIDRFESMLRKSQHPEALQTINWIRLHSYDLYIPEEILVLLPRTSQFKYGLARRLRESGFAQTMPPGEERLPMVAGE